MAGSVVPRRLIISWEVKYILGVFNAIELEVETLWICKRRPEPVWTAVEISPVYKK